MLLLLMEERDEGTAGNTFKSGAFNSKLAMPPPQQEAQNNP